jgi:DNA-directed RNA polymerase specialized sigma54-like protein
MVNEMTVAQFAHKLKVNRSTVYRMINAKALPDGVEAFSVLGKVGLKVNADFKWPK